MNLIAWSLIVWYAVFAEGTVTMRGDLTTRSRCERCAVIEVTEPSGYWSNPKKGADHEPVRRDRKGN